MGDNRLGRWCRAVIANARMYSVTPAVAVLWRRLLEAVALRAGVAILIIEHSAPAPITELWARRDQGAVFMCGLPFSEATPQLELVAAPVPAPPHYRNQPQYWSEFVVRADSSFQRLEDTFGGRIAFTAPHSQSGYAAAISHLMSAGGTTPLYRDIIAPCLTPRGALSTVSEGRADIAPVDSFALDLLRRHEPALVAQFRVVATTEPLQSRLSLPRWCRRRCWSRHSLRRMPIHGCDRSWKSFCCIGSSSRAGPHTNHSGTSSRPRPTSGAAIRSPRRPTRRSPSERTRRRRRDCDVTGSRH